jgi:hypothetical protein
MFPSEGNMWTCGKTGHMRNFCWTDKKETFQAGQRNKGESAGPSPQSGSSDQRKPGVIKSSGPSGKVKKGTTTGKTLVKVRSVMADAVKEYEENDAEEYDDGDNEPSTTTCDTQGDFYKTDYITFFIM